MARKRNTSASSFWNMTSMAVEAQHVILLRLAKLAAGGPTASAEAHRMVNEKITASISAGHQLMMGATPDSVMNGYRRKVQANLKRLSKAR